MAAQSLLYDVRGVTEAKETSRIINLHHIPCANELITHTVGVTWIWSVIVGYVLELSEWIVSREAYGRSSGECVAD